MYHSRAPLRVVFFGTADFGIPTLHHFIQDPAYEIRAVVTAPDRKGGRGMRQILQSPIKRYALEHGLRIFQPPNLKAPDFVDCLAALEADVFVVVAFRMLPEVVWSMPPLGTFNLHASLLPRYRGAAPIHWAILRGESLTGLTTFKIQHRIDTGDIADQVVVPISPTDTFGTLYRKLQPLGPLLMAKTLDKLRAGRLVLHPQDDRYASPAPKFFHRDCRIDFHQPGWAVYNFIRGLSPHPTAWTLLEGKELKIFSARLAQTHQLQPGQIYTNQRDTLRIGTLDRDLVVEEVQLAGKRRMPIREFLNGYTITTKCVG